MEHADFDYITSNEVLHDTSQILKPRRRISVSGAAEESMFVSTPGGYSGRWKSSTTPYMKEPMDCMAMREFNSVVFVGSARTGKTMGLLDGAITYICTSDPSDMLIVHMTEEAARRYSRLRVGRLIDNSPDLKKLLSTKQNDNNILSKFMCIFYEIC